MFTEKKWYQYPSGDILEKKMTGPRGKVINLD